RGTRGWRAEEEMPCPKPDAEGGPWRGQACVAGRRQELRVACAYSVVGSMLNGTITRTLAGRPRLMPGRNFHWAAAARHAGARVLSEPDRTTRSFVLPSRVTVSSMRTWALLRARRNSYGIFGCTVEITFGCCSSSLSFESASESSSWELSS